MKGKKVVIIGGSSGMGLAAAKAAVSEGALVLIASRSKEKLDRAKALIGRRVAARELDVTDEEQVRKFFEQIGEFDHLVTTAAEGVAGEFLALDTEAVRALFESKFWGQYRAAKQAARYLFSGGSITFFSGVASEKPFPGLSSYAAANGAINSLCRSLAVELAPIRVNAVSPGIVDTPAYGGLPEKERGEFFASLGGKLPVGRIGRPEDVAEAVLFLMKCDYATGEVVHVDGGNRVV